MLKGYICAICSMAFFGLAFSLPLLIPYCTPLEIAVGRFGCFGLISLASIATQKRNEKALPPLTHFPMALICCLTGFLLFYGCLVAGIQQLGGPTATLLASLLPICVSLYGNFLDKDFPFSTFFIPLSLIFLGIVSIHYEGLFISLEYNLSDSLIGIAYVLISVAMWAWFAVHNGKFLKQHPEVSSRQWANLIGLLCLIASLVSWLYAYATNPQWLFLLSEHATQEQVMRFITTSALLGLGGSYLSMFFWNKASRVVPMGILGQLVILEVIFGLSYIYLIEQAFPNKWEILGISFVLLGLVSSFIKIRQVKLQKQMVTVETSSGNHPV